MQFIFVGALDAALAGERRAGIRLDVEGFLVVFADRADVADRVHAALTERVEARQTRDDLDAGEVAGGVPRTAQALLPSIAA